MFLKSGRVSYGGMITAAMVVLLYLSCVFENCSLFCLAAGGFLRRRDNLAERVEGWIAGFCGSRCIRCSVVAK